MTPAGPRRSAAQGQNGTQHLRRAAVAATLAAAAVAVPSGLGHATGTAQHGVARVGEADVKVADRIRMNEKRARTCSSRTSRCSPWQYHPGPHIVAVKKGAVQIYEVDCSLTTYPAGTGFFDPGPTQQPHVHTLRNPSATEPAEVVITDVRSGDPRPTVVVDQQPEPCFS